MKIANKNWKKYVNQLSKIDKKASQMMEAWITNHGIDDRDALLSYASSLVERYGAASSELACEMYDAIAEQSGVLVPPAVPADTMRFPEIAKAVNGVLKRSKIMVPQTVGNGVKRAAADTMLQNAQRDGAEFAWIPSGDTCAFCLVLASKGWQHVSKKALKNGHAEHIHSNCDCQYAVRFDDNTDVEGYNPDKLRKIYDCISDGDSNEKINALRRALSGKNKLTIDQLEFIIDLEENGSMLGSKTPAEWKKHLIELGFDVKTLSSGKLKGISFEEGGGYKINYRGDGYFQFHPEGTHHNGSYYKRSNGKQGTVRFNLDGSVKYD